MAKKSKPRTDASVIKRAEGQSKVTHQQGLYIGRSLGFTAKKGTSFADMVRAKGVKSGKAASSVIQAMISQGVLMRAGQKPTATQKKKAEAIFRKHATKK